MSLQVCWQKTYRPNRLEALKDVAAEFIKDRPNDRIGLVVYAGESFTQRLRLQVINLLC